MSLALVYAKVTCKVCGMTCSSYQVAENVDLFAQKWADQCPDHQGGSR